MGEIRGGGYKERMKKATYYLNANASGGRLESLGCSKGFGVKQSCKIGGVGQRFGMGM